MASSFLPSLLLLFFFFFFMPPSLFSQPLSPDVLLLIEKIKPALGGNSENFLLASWNTTIPLCQWRGLQWGFQNGTILDCESHSPNYSTSTNQTSSLLGDPSLQLLSLQLPAAGLAGELPRELGKFSALRSIFLDINSLSGGIPLELGNSPALSDVDLHGNALSGPLPPSIWNLCDRLGSLHLEGNRLSGELPRPALPNVSCPSLVSLKLGSNRFDGEFPDFIAGFTSLKELDLGNNLFSGPVPETLLRMQSLTSLNLSHNNFSGTLPRGLRSRFGEEAFAGNPISSNAKPGLSPGAIAGVVIASMAGLVILSSVSIGLLQKRKKKKGDVSEEEADEEWGGGEGKLVLFQGGEHLNSEEILNATGQVIAKTSYGTVYKAKLGDGGVISLRLLREGSCREREWCLPLVREMGRVRHDNLVPLRAFYEGERGEKLLVFDYLPNKTLHDLLHAILAIAETRAGKPMLNWVRRHKIALGIARGLAYLHTGLETPLIHGNLKSKNILVDEFYVTRLTEFGLDKLMVPAVTEEMLTAIKSEGYKAPELQKMSKCNTRTDIYSFGILLLEILLGKKPGKDARTGDFIDLPAIVKIAVLEENTMEVFDVEVLRGIRSPMEDGLVQALKLAMGCCAPVPSVRPDIGEVVKQLEENRPRNRSALYSPTETRSGMDTPY
ncbi:putative kinase-like protein [Nymphaea thermarum]|nr:putative kinase-like protein [Nymphaea thermarum]